MQALISKIFSFAVDASLRDDHPCHRLKKRGAEKAGRRVLSDAEIPLFWNGIVTPPRRPPDRPRACGSRFLTGARVSEIAGLSRAELHDIESPANAAWQIPGARTKNDRDHLIPLAPLARETCGGPAGDDRARRALPFPTRSRRRVGPITGNTLTQAMSLLRSPDASLVMTRPPDVAG